MNYAIEILNNEIKSNDKKMDKILNDVSEGKGTEDSLTCLELLTESNFTLREAINHLAKNEDFLSLTCIL